MHNLTDEVPGQDRSRATRIAAILIGLVVLGSVIGTVLTNWN